MSIFGKSYGSKITGHIVKNGKELVIKDVQDAIDQKIAYVPRSKNIWFSIDE